jgi:hypothetical protein
MDEEDWAFGSASGGGNIAPVIERRREEKTGSDVYRF